MYAINGLVAMALVQVSLEIPPATTANLSCLPAPMRSAFETPLWGTEDPVKRWARLSELASEEFGSEGDPLPLLPELRPRYLVDDEGREIVLHGLNVSNSSKEDPLLGWTTEAEWAQMQAWGFNFVRLVINWSQIEPVQDEISEDYLDRIVERLDWGERYGLYVLVDFHQDVYGPRFGSNGCPDWATRDDGLPFEGQDPWWLSYLQPAVRAAFSHLWRDDDLQVEYADAAAAVAARVGEHPALIGYDLMNEPFQGNELGLFENRRLRPFFRRVSAAIRTEDPDARVFFEPAAFPTSSGLPSRMLPYGDANAVYAPHFYHPLVHEGMAYRGNRTLLALAIYMKAMEAERHVTPMVIGEFGAWHDDRNQDQYLHDLMSIFDRLAGGWAFWSYDPGVLTDEGGDWRFNLEAIVRPYPRRVSGKIVGYHFDRVARKFELRWQSRQGLDAPTEIHLPVDRFYPAGFMVRSTDAEERWRYEFEGGTGILRVWHDPATTDHELIVSPANTSKRIAPRNGGMGGRPGVGVGGAGGEKIRER